VIVFNPGSVTVTRYRYRGDKIPNPYLRTNTTPRLTVESRVR